MQISLSYRLPNVYVHAPVVQQKVLKLVSEAFSLHLCVLLLKLRESFPSRLSGHNYLVIWRLRCMCTHLGLYLFGYLVPRAVRNQKINNDFCFRHGIVSQFQLHTNSLLYGPPSISSPTTLLRHTVRSWQVIMSTLWFYT